MIRVLNVPGLWDSGPEHWHTFWEAADPEIRRVVQPDWDAPERREWVRNLDDAVQVAGHGVVLAAHSLGCATVVHWAGLPHRVVRGALLVAPADVDGPGFPLEARGFADMPLKELPFPTILVASSNDPYLTPERAQLFAESWGSRLVDVGPGGHLNSESRLGEWPEGRALLQELLALPQPDPPPVVLPTPFPPETPETDVA